MFIIILFMQSNPSIIVSRTDPAGMNVSDFLIHDFDFGKTERQFHSLPIYSNGKIDLVFIKEIQVHADYVNELPSPLFIFASKHKSDSGKPCFTVHPIGNFSKAEVGGKDNTLIPTSAVFNKLLFLSLFNEAGNSRLPWDVVMEVSHHGPFLEKPAVFIEIGSSEKQWTEKEAARVLAYAIMKATKLKAKEYKVAIGAGGTHYCPEFTKVQLKTDIALSHIVSKYAVDSLKETTFKQMTEKTVEKVDLMLLDWKGLSSEQRQKMIAFCERGGIEYKKTRDFL